MSALACACFLLWRWSLLADWCRAPSPLNVVVVELQGQLLARGRELDSREGAIAMWEDGLMAFECALGKVSAERDASRIRAVAVL
jgi:hypothetical protein